MPSEPRILTIDIETRPPKVYSWGLFNQNIGIEQVIDPGGTMGFGAKWHGRPAVMWYSDFHNGHEQMIQKAWDLLDQADIVVHYNGKSFDIPHLRTEFKKLGLGQPSPFVEVDLLKTVRKQFRLLSNKLDFVLQHFGIGKKVSHTGFRLWRECDEGDPKAWALMRRYCKGDVIGEEALFDYLRGWLVGFPHIGLYTGDLSDETCPQCGSTDGQWRGSKKTQQGAYRQRRCNTCGHWYRVTRAVEMAHTRSVAV